MELALQDSLLVAVRAKALPRVLGVNGRTDSVALKPLRAHLRHVGRARSHGRERGRVVVRLELCLQHGERLGVQTRRAGRPIRISIPCLLYTSDAADERSSVDLGG